MSSRIMASSVVIAGLLLTIVAWQAGILGSHSGGPTTQGNPTPVAGGNARDVPVPPHAVILMYHRFGEDRYPATSLRTAQLDAHIAYLQENDFNVLPLPEVIDRFENGAALPPRTIAITVDDAYQSAFDVARPRFDAAGMPWTLFVTTDQPDRGLGDFMSWEQIRELDADPAVTIGHHSGAHHHLPDYDTVTNRHDTARASRRFREELGHVPNLYAYPFGEYSNDVLSMIRGFEFQAAFGQHSGVAHAAAPRFELPRFAMNENWGSMERFIERVHSKPLPVRDVTPTDSLVVRNNPPRLQFTISDPDINPDQIGCYPSGGIDAGIERDGRTLTVTPSTPFPPGRARINCTAPFGDGSHRWFGRQFVVRNAAPGGHEPRPDPGAGTPEAPDA